MRIRSEMKDIKKKPLLGEGDWMSGKRERLPTGMKPKVA